MTLTVTDSLHHMKDLPWKSVQSKDTASVDLGEILHVLLTKFFGRTVGYHLSLPWTHHLHQLLISHVR